MRIIINILSWHDLWVGVRWDSNWNTLWIAPIPTIIIRIKFKYKQGD